MFSNLGDPSLELKVYWLWNKSLVEEKVPLIYITPDNTLVINFTHFDGISRQFVGDYTCVGDNGLTKRAVTAKLLTPVSKVRKDVKPQSSPAVKNTVQLFSEGTCLILIIL